MWWDSMLAYVTPTGWTFDINNTVRLMGVSGGKPLFVPGEMPNMALTHGYLSYLPDGYMYNFYGSSAGPPLIPRQYGQCQ